jgi:hypothetical protein
VDLVLELSIREQVQSKQREGASMLLAVQPDEVALHKTQVGVEKEPGGLTRITVARRWDGC